MKKIFSKKKNLQSSRKMHKTSFKNYFRPYCYSKRKCVHQSSSFDLMEISFFSRWYNNNCDSIKNLIFINYVKIHALKSQYRFCGIIRLCVYCGTIFILHSNFIHMLSVFYNWWSMLIFPSSTCIRIMSRWSIRAHRMPSIDERKMCAIAGSMNSCCLKLLLSHFKCSQH